MKFKVGDLVRVNKKSLESGIIDVINLYGRVCTIIKVLRDYNMYQLDKSGYLLYEEELDLSYIPDTKIGRRLYKNKIKEIKDGKIWLK